MATTTTKTIWRADGQGDFLCMKDDDDTQSAWMRIVELHNFFFLLLNIIYLTEARRRITATVEDGVTLMLGNAVDKYDGLFTNIVPKVYVDRCFVAGDVVILILALR